METAGVRLVAEGAAAFNSNLERAAKSTMDFGRNADTASRGIDLMDVATTALGTALSELALRGFDAATAAIGNFIQSGFDYNKSIENATAQLVAFTGSQEAAAEALALVERRASQTPFAFDEMAQSAASLAATSRATGASLEELLGLAERLAASNPAEGLEGAAFALREAFSGDFMSLQERFNIGKADIARIKEMGVSVESLDMVMSELGITTELVSGLAQTFDGRMSTLLDTFTKLAGELTKPIFDFFSEAIADVQIGLDNNIEAWSVWAKSVGQSVADSFQTAKEAWAGEWEDDEIIQPIHRFVGKATLAVKGMWDKLVAFATENGPKIQAQWDKMAENITSLETAWEPLNRVLAEGGRLLNEIGTAINTIYGALVLGNPEWATMNERASESKTLGERLADIFNEFADAMGWLADKLHDVRVRFEQLFDFLAGIDNATLQTLGAISGLIFEGVSGSPAPQAGPGNVPDTSPASPPGGVNTVPDSNGVVVPLPPPVQAPPVAAPTPSPNATNKTSINVNVNIPPNVSPATASQIVTNGVLQAQRSRGMT